MYNPIRISLMAMAMAALAAACSSTGPVELTAGFDIDEEVSCTRSSTCLERGLQAKRKGRFPEAFPDLVEACERGQAAGCRHLANMDVLGAMGEPNLERAEALYRWGCEEGGEGASCHSLGELYRLGLHPGEELEGARRYFSMACERGEFAGCHDAAVVLIEGRSSDEDEHEEAFSVFEESCERGESIGCVNLAYMKASGWGTVRDHDAAQQLFERECERGDDGFESHRLATLSRDAEPGAYAVAEFRPQVACEQLEVLVVGRQEEMIMAVMDAERESLRQCYNDARRADEVRTGRLMIEADVAMDSRADAPTVVEDSLGLEEVNRCVERVLSRHFDELNEENAPYRVRWGISFVHPPDEDAGAEAEEEPGGCDVQEVQLAISEAFADLQACGDQHIRRNPDDPGALVALWEMGPSGRAQTVSVTSTVSEGGLVSCLESVITSMQISPFEGAPCPVEVPFVFSSGEELHFSVVGRR